MARPLAFGVRLRDGKRTVRVRAHENDARRYVVEETHTGRASRRREHGSLDAALRDLARAWRQRLH